jgi:hypothetical protein
MSEYTEQYPEPSGEIVARERGATTLIECGWCEYASGTHRYNYCISGHCSLQKSYSKEVHWDDKCYFLTTSQSDVLNLIDYHKREIKNAENEIKREKKYIKLLEKKFFEAPKRPDLPENRKYNHFKLGSDVAVYFKEDNKWHFGKVVLGYRHEDGCVSYVLKDIGPQTGNFWGCGVSVPIVMLKSEYDFFEDHPDEYKIWCEKAYNKTYNGEKLVIAPIPQNNS